MDTEEESPQPNGSGAKWATLSVCALRSGVSVRHLTRLAERGELKRKREHEDGTGNWLYHVADACALASARLKKLDTPEVAMSKAQTDLLTKTAQTLDRAWTQLHDMHEPILDVVTELRTALKEANADNRALREEMRKSDQARREFENAEHEKRMAEEIVRREQERKDAAIESVKKAAEHVWPDVRDALLGASLLSKFKKTFDPAKIQALLAVPGMLSEEEADLLRETFGIPKTPADVVETEGSEAHVDE